MKKMKKGKTILKGLLKKHNTNIKEFKLLIEDDYPLVEKKIEEIIKKSDEIYMVSIEPYEKIKEHKYEINIYKKKDKEQKQIYNNYLNEYNRKKSFLDKVEKEKYLKPLQEMEKNNEELKKIHKQLIKKENEILDGLNLDYHKIENASNMLENYMDILVKIVMEGLDENECEL
ncbi:hypothetical protein N493_07350 [Clostridium botulinum B2 433]|uniref:hypothetical protein n=1 Tax=Clostridium botulinum TaxID=1491 RepID=UPI0007DF4D47|nr:hypothetical protein [Clostridium botulinum]KEI89318.1 hypothetical protein N493_07350 [Clostridium botulinum B2 433]